MKTDKHIKSFWIVLLLVMAGDLSAQKKISFDLAGIRNTRKSVNGLNVSGFFHFSERFVGGIEINRFFPVKKTIPGEEVKISAWDFDLNFHYILPLYKKWKWYPLSGISHTSEKELHASPLPESLYERFWSFNTGIGMLWETGKLSPHIEYNFTWGHLNQQFLLAGFSYELGWGKSEKGGKE